MQLVLLLQEQALKSGMPVMDEAEDVQSGRHRGETQFQGGDRLSRAIDLPVHAGTVAIE